MEELLKIALLMLKSLGYSIQVIGDFGIYCNQFTQNRNTLWWAMGAIFCLGICFFVSDFNS